MDIEESKNISLNQKKLSNTELSYFCSQMALVLHSGISTLEGISMMLEDNADKKDSEILSSLLHGMESYGLLHIALKNSGVFPNYMIHMVQIGEETGNLDEVMVALSKHYEREESIRTSVSHAVSYPLIMSGMILAVIIVLLVRVMPIFSQVFKQLGTEMTGFAAGLVTIGETISSYSLIFVIILALVIIFVLVCLKTGLGVRIIRLFKGARDLSLSISAGRFADGMALTLKSGLAPDRSFDLVSSLNEDPEFAKRLSDCKVKMENGLDLSESLHKSGIFSGIYARMANVGSKAGALDIVMSQIADLYQEEIDTRINNTLSVVEPALIIVLSIVVGIILISVMFPLLGIMSSI